MNKKKRDNKKKIKEFVRAYVAHLAGNASVIAPDEPANPDDLPDPPRATAG